MRPAPTCLIAMTVRRAPGTGVIPICTAMNKLEGPTRHGEWFLFVYTTIPSPDTNSKSQPRQQSSMPSRANDASPVVALPSGFLLPLRHIRIVSRPRVYIASGTAVMGAIRYPRHSQQRPADVHTVGC
ncbi:hypothetical protein BKA81DRAFT_156302 [Phyllosticta paracitricarpa]